MDQGGNLYLAWSDAGNGDADIYFARSTDGGLTWSANLQISDATSIAGQGHPGLVAGGGGGLYAVWTDYRNWIYDVYFSSSTGPSARLPGRR